MRRVLGAVAWVGREVRGNHREMVCICGHKRLAHTHHRAGSDCSRCPCDRFSWGVGGPQG